MIWGSHSSGYEEFYLVGYNIFKIAEWAMQVTSSAVLSSCFQAGLWLGSFFYHEAKDSMFLQTVGWLSTKYMVLWRHAVA
jgi:hypothetical protein